MHFYDEPGTYTVTLAISGPYGGALEIKKDYIIILKTPTGEEIINHLLGRVILRFSDINGDNKTDISDLIGLLSRQDM